jgi:hypothetical protein
MDILINIIIALLCALVPTIITLWLNEKVKGNVKNSFDEKLEQLKKEHSKEIAQFQIELNHLKSKENFKFTKLHEKRLEVLAQTYEHINLNLGLLKKYINPSKEIPQGISSIVFEKELRNAFRESHNKLSHYFKSNAIYFSDDIEKLMTSFFIASAKTFKSYDESFSLIDKGEIPEQEQLDKAKIAYKQIPKLIHPIQRKIKINFRELLGE